MRTVRLAIAVAAALAATAGCSGNASDAPSGGTPAGGGHTLMLEATGSRHVDVRYSLVDLGGKSVVPQQKKQDNVAVPWHTTVRLAAHASATFTVSAALSNPHGDVLSPVGCQATLDGRVVDSEKSQDGRIGMATCTVTAGG